MPELSMAEFDKLAEILYKATGILYDTKKKYLFDSRLSRRLEELELDSFSEFIDQIDGKGKEQKKLDILINAVTTNETSFFRNKPQFDVFQKVLIPEMVKQKRESGKKKIKIWSAASSTGEEIYTLAMISKVEGLIPTDFQLELIGSDINDEVLQLAAEVFYPKYSVRNTPEKYKKRFFTTEENFTFKLKKELLPPVTFKKVNLIDINRHNEINDFDLVYCANVMIYFSTDVRIKVVKDIFAKMVSPGYFMIGHAETLHGISKDFKLTNVNNVPIYKKE